MTIQVAKVWFLPLTLQAPHDLVRSGACILCAAGSHLEGCSGLPCWRSGFPKGALGSSAAAANVCICLTLTTSGHSSVAISPGVLTDPTLLFCSCPATQAEGVEAQVNVGTDVLSPENVNVPLHLSGEHQHASCQPQFKPKLPESTERREMRTPKVVPDPHKVCVWHVCSPTYTH